MKLPEQRFRQIFREQYPALSFYAARIVSDNEAEDVVQEAFMELWKRKEDIESESHIKAFLYRTVYTRALNLVKHRSVVNNYSEAAKKVEQFRLNYYNPETNDVISHIESLELRKHINNAIADLPEKCREVFTLSYLHDRKNKEIAEQLGISVRTVEVHIYKALKILRGKLKGSIYLIITFFIICH
ncbi:MAG: RNA polymerase sigma-70 factor [Prevotella sp.]|nr:RNA polymerase sigma-70 factor [Prevotella sp.]